MAGCEACRSWVSELARASWVEAEAPSDRPAPSPPEASRYLPLAKLGAGAMGTVWAAYDVELEREVALKVLDAQTPSDERVRKEARALAALSHPNVVEVLDVLLSASRPAIAMELVEGPTLRDWVSIATRTWQEILEVFAGAGRGLAAAHAVGLVHRDFKPSNVIVGAEGRARVVDFGLALGTGGDDAQDVRRRVGTPAYMAPEQLAGRPATPRSDQFAWCVALHEALYGARPDAARSTPGAGNRVPRRLRRILQRGMHEDPTQRWPSMPDLLAALHHPRRWKGALAATGALAVAAFLVSDAEQDPCAQRGASTLLHEVPSTPVSAAREQLVDRVRAWEAADLEACRSSSSHRGARACLQRQHQHLALAQDALASADPLEALQTVERLPDAAECLRPSSVQERLSQSDIAFDAEIIAIKVTSDAGDPSTALKRAEEIRKELEWRAGPAVRSRFAYAFAKVLTEAGRDGTAWFESAARAGTTGGDRRVAARAAMALGGGSSPATPTDPTEAARWLARAQVLIESDDMTDLEQELQLARGTADLNAGRYEAAVPSLRDAVASANESAAPAHVRALALTRLAEGLRLSGGLEESEQIQRQALDLLETNLGRAHPRTALARADLAAIHSAAGRVEEARDDFQRALAVLEAALGPKHVLVAVVATNLATAHMLLDEPGQAVELLQRVTEIERKLPPGRATASTWHALGNAHVLLNELDEAHSAFSTGLDQIQFALGREHPDCAFFLSSLASLALDRGEPDDAVRLANESRTLHESAFGSDDPRLAFEDLVLAGAHLDQEKPELALSVIERAVALLEQNPIRPRWQAELQFFRARALHQLGDTTEAQAQAEAAAQAFASLGDPAVAEEIRGWRDDPD